jgi:hypothetical protein
VARKSTAHDRILDLHQADLDEIARPGLIASGMDREGMPPMTGIGGLPQLEDYARRRFSPRKNRWKDVVEFDRRVAELEARRSEIQARLQPLHDQLSNATNTDAEAVAGWIDKGEHGDRPESVEPALKKQVAELTREADALVLAIGAELQRKSEYVAKHRARLCKDARRHVEAAHAQAVERIAAAEQARADLELAREAELWASLFPGDQTAPMPPFAKLAGGLKRVGERLGVAEAIGVDRLYEALREDAAWLKDAATPAQRAEIDGIDPRQSGAVWVGSPEHIAQDRADKRAALEAYKRQWGNYPA